MGGAPFVEGIVGVDDVNVCKCFFILFVSRRGFRCKTETRTDLMTF